MTDTAAKIIEALIFASAAPVPRDILQRHIPDTVLLDDILRDIAARYGEDSGIELVRVGSCWAFRTKADIAAYLNIEKSVERPLSRAALETAAIIAYHQPTTRSEIEAIRGVSIRRRTLDLLLEMGWIKPRGRRRTPGLPLTWGTTPAFLDYFGLDDIDSLPGLDELKATGLLRSMAQIADDSQGFNLFNAASDDDDDDEGEESDA